MNRLGRLSWQRSPLPLRRIHQHPRPLPLQDHKGTETLPRFIRFALLPFHRTNPDCPPVPVCSNHITRFRLLQSPFQLPNCFRLLDRSLSTLPSMKRTQTVHLLPSAARHPSLLCERDGGVAGVAVPVCRVALAGDRGAAGLQQRGAALFPAPVHRVPAQMSPVSKPDLHSGRFCVFRQVVALPTE